MSQLTVSELIVFGTAISSSSCCSVSDEAEDDLISVCAKEQKFMVFT